MEIRSTPILTLLPPKGYGVQVAMGALKYARELHSWDVRRAVPPLDPAFIDEVKPRGIIAHVSSQPIARMLHESLVPVVNVWGSGNLDFPVVSTDDVAIGQLAAQHLLNRGYRRLVCTTSSREIYAQERAKGFLRAAAGCAESSMAVDIDIIRGEAASQSDEERALAGWLASLRPPIGLFAGIHWGASMLGPIAKKVGLRIPHDLAVIVVSDDPNVCELDDPPLTSVDYPAVHIGYEAARTLHRIMQGETPPRTPVLFPPIGVTERASTNAYCVADEDVAAALVFIRQNACKGATVKQVASASHLTERTLQRRFRQYVGRTIHAELSRVRIEQAKQLLAEGELSFQQVAVRSGLTSVSRMCHTFRAYLAITPKSYREQFRRTV